MGLCQRLQTSSGGCVECQPMTLAAISLRRRPRKISPQFEQRRSARELRLPIVQLPLEPFARQPFTLPIREVRVLNRELGQRRRFTREIRLIKRRDLTNKDARRPTIGGNMME